MLTHPLRFSLESTLQLVYEEGRNLKSGLLPEYSLCVLAFD